MLLAAPYSPTKEEATELVAAALDLKGAEVVAEQIPLEKLPKNVGVVAWRIRAGEVDLLLTAGADPLECIELSDFPDEMREIFREHRGWLRLALLGMPDERFVRSDRIYSLVAAFGKERAKLLDVDSWCVWDREVHEALTGKEARLALRRLVAARMDENAASYAYVHRKQANSEPERDKNLQELPLAVRRNPPGSCTVWARLQVGDAIEQLPLRIERIKISNWAYSYIARLEADSKFLDHYHAGEIFELNENNIIRWETTAEEKSNPAQ